MTPPEKTKPKILLLIFPDFTEFEIAIAIQLLHQQYEIITVAPRLIPVRSEAGIHVTPHISIDQVHTEEFAGLIVSAAPNMEAALNNDQILDLIRSMDRQGKVVAAICGAPMLLGKAGILRERAYTVSLYRRYREFLGFFDEQHFRNEPVVEIENLITAQGYAYAEFGIRLAERLHALKDIDAVKMYYCGKGDIHWETEEEKGEDDI